MRSRILLTMLLVLIASMATAQTTNCGVCYGHFFLENTNYPFSEDIEKTPLQDSSVPQQIVLTTNWQTILKGCPTKGGVNYHGNVYTNAQLRSYVALDTGTPGARYEVRFKRADQPNTEYGWFVRQVKNSGFHQGEFFFSALQHVEPGPHVFEMQARLLDAGQNVTIGTRWMSSQGTPSDAAPGLPSRYPSDANVALDAYTMNGQWRSDILPTITFTNTETVDLFPQAYLEVTGGTPGDQISFGFQLDSEPSSRRNSDAAVPAAFPGYATREGINITDHIENVPPGTHTLRFWAVSRTGRAVTVGARALQFVSFKRDNGSNGMQFAMYPDPNNPDPLRRTTHVAPPPIDSSLQPTQLAYGQSGLPFGYWYPVSQEFRFDPNPPGIANLDWTGIGYVELLGRSGDWSDARAEMMVETYHFDTAQQKIIVTDMGWVPVTIPQGRGHLYFLIDASNWGNQYGNNMRVWLRKVLPVPGATFTVGKVYASMKLVPMNGCWTRGF